MLHDAPLHLDLLEAGRDTLAEPLLTAADVSVLLGIPRSSVYTYARRGEDPMPSVRLGRHRRFYRSELERWVGRQRDPGV